MSYLFANAVNEKLNLFTRPEIKEKKNPLPSQLPR